MIVFVHGVPETGALWRKVRAAIGGESVAVDLPGFGTSRPDGFGATKDDYVDWLVGELDRIGEPVDLVGHDWGAILTYRVAAAFGGRLRSWAADCGNLVHPDYEWHDFARIWQTPGDGEAFFDGQAATPLDDLAAAYEGGLGLDADDARELAAGSSREMGSCILDLYRSATPNPAADWGPWSPTVAPGLVIHTSGDPFSDERMAREAADALAAGFEVLDAPGHFWPYQAPEAGAALLQRFWSTLGVSGVHRVSVVGNSGSGKSSLARALADRLGVRYVELDELNHQPGWQERSSEELRTALAPLLADGGWVVDGNYRNRVGDLVRGAADTVVWLDFARPVVMSRVVRRTVRRVVTREELWNGNREPLSNLWSTDPQRSIIAWSWTQHRAYRARYEAEAADPANAGLAYVRLRTPREARRWLSGVRPD